jgi:hypothetical protein
MFYIALEVNYVKETVIFYSYCTACTCSVLEFAADDIDWVGGWLVRYVGM